TRFRQNCALQITLLSGNPPRAKCNTALYPDIQTGERPERKFPMTARVVILAVATSCLAAVCTSCAGSHTARANVAATQAGALDDVALRPNPNAPYIIPGGTPRLIPRATALD